MSQLMLSKHTIQSNPSLLTLTLLSIAMVGVLSACSQHKPITPQSTQSLPVGSAVSVETAEKAEQIAATREAIDTAEIVNEVYPIIIVQPVANVANAASAKMAQSTVQVQPLLLGYSVSQPPAATEHYAEVERNAINATRENAFATLSIDTDTGSYANVRRFLNQGSLPPSNAVRIEELINYFNYDFSDAKKQGGAPFLVSTETVASPWHDSNRIIKVGIKAEDVDSANQQLPANLVFLVDVSGSMSSADKLQLAKSSLKMLAKELNADDSITLITYAGNTEIVLPATAGNNTSKIIAAIDNLDAGGSTNGEAAIKLAYQQAEENYKQNGINRILMLTDGDFNVGVSDTEDMLDIIRNHRDKGISLSTLGFGQGNYNDHMMEQVADNGNGNYSYIDSLSEAKKVLIDEMSATFNTVAKDVKIQVEFNPNTISEWRLIGYENRVLAREDFANDQVDAGDLGAGKSVVALFEVTPVGSPGLLGESRYQVTSANEETRLNQANQNEFGFLRIRYKAPGSDTSTQISFPISNQVSQPTVDTKFAMAVAAYGQLLTHSKYINDWTYADSKRLATAGIGTDKQGTRRQFIELVELADVLD